MISFGQRISQLNCKKHGLEVQSINISKYCIDRGLCKQCKINGTQIHRDYMGELLKEFFNDYRQQLLLVISQFQTQFNDKYIQILNTLPQFKETFENKLAEFSEKEYLQDLYDSCFGCKIINNNDLECVSKLLSNNIEIDYDQIKTKINIIKNQELQDYIDILDHFLNNINGYITQISQMKLDIILPKYDKEISSLAISNDNKSIAVVSLSKEIDIWNIKKQTKITLNAHDEIVNVVLFSNDSKTLYTGGRDGIVKIWKYVLQWKIHDILIGHEDWITALAIQNQYIASASDKEIFLWKLKLDHYIIFMKLKGHMDSIYSLSFHNNLNYLISGSYDKTVRLWGNEKWEFLQQFYYHSDKVQSVVFCNNQLFASCSWDQSIRLYNEMTDGQFDCFQVLYGHQGKVYQIQYQNDILYSSSNDNTIRLWSQNQENNLFECFHLIRQDFHIKHISLSENYLVSSNYYEIYVYIK